MAYILTADRQITAYMLQSKALNATNRRAMLSQGAHRSAFRILTRVVGPGWSSYCDRNTRPPRSVNLLGGVLSESPQIDLAGLVHTADQLAEQIARDRQRLDSLNATVELLKDDPMPPTPRPRPKLKTLKLPAGMGREQPTAIPAVSPEPDPPVQDRAVDNMAGAGRGLQGSQEHAGAATTHRASGGGALPEPGDHDSLPGANADGQGDVPKPADLHPHLHCQAPPTL